MSAGEVVSRKKRQRNSGLIKRTQNFITFWNKQNKTKQNKCTHELLRADCVNQSGK